MIPGMRSPRIGQPTSGLVNHSTHGDAPGAISPVRSDELNALMQRLADALTPRYEIAGPYTFGGANVAKTYTLDCPFLNGGEVAVAAFVFTGAGQASLSTAPGFPQIPGATTELDTSSGAGGFPRSLWVGAASGAGSMVYAGLEWTQLAGGNVQLYFNPQAGGKAVYVTVFFRRRLDARNVIQEAVQP